jgi:hypothetical protein
MAFRKPPRFPVGLVAKVALMRAERNRTRASQPLVLLIAHNVIAGTHIGYEVHGVMLPVQVTDRARFDVIAPVIIRAGG